MKKWIVYLLGVISGIVLTFVFFFVVSKIQNSDVIVFDKPGDVVNVNSFEVFQVLDQNSALAYEGSYGPVCLLVNDAGKTYYDEQVIRVPKGKVARIIGTYKYKTNGDFEKTVPIIQIFDE